MAYKKLRANSLVCEEAQKSNPGLGRGFICQSWGFCDYPSLSHLGQPQGICQYCHISSRKKKEALRQKWNMSAPVPTPKKTFSEFHPTTFTHISLLRTVTQPTLSAREFQKKIFFNLGLLPFQTKSGLEREKKKNEYMIAKAYYQKLVLITSFCY